MQRSGMRGMELASALTQLSREASQRSGTSGPPSPQLPATPMPSPASSRPPSSARRASAASTRAASGGAIANLSEGRDGTADLAAQPPQASGLLLRRPGCGPRSTNDSSARSSGAHATISEQSSERRSSSSESTQVRIRSAEDRRQTDAPAITTASPGASSYPSRAHRPGTAPAGAVGAQLQAVPEGSEVHAVATRMDGRTLGSAASDSWLVGSSDGSANAGSANVSIGRGSSASARSVSAASPSTSRGHAEPISARSVKGASEAQSTGAAARPQGADEHTTAVPRAPSLSDALLTAATDSNGPSACDAQAQSGHGGSSAACADAPLASSPGLWATGTETDQQIWAQNRSTPLVDSGADAVATLPDGDGQCSGEDGGLAECAKAAEHIQADLQAALTRRSRSAPPTRAWYLSTRGVCLLVSGVS